MFLVPAVIEQVKAQESPKPILSAIQAKGPNLSERVLIFKVCALLGIPLKQIGIISDRGNAPVLIIDAEMSPELIQRIQVGFEGVYSELGVVDSKGRKFLLTEK